MVLETLLLQSPKVPKDSVSLFITILGTGVYEHNECGLCP